MKDGYGPWPWRKVICLLFMFLPTDKRHNHHTHNKFSNVFHMPTVFQVQYHAAIERFWHGIQHFWLKHHSWQTETDRNVHSIWVSPTRLAVENLSNKPSCSSTWQTFMLVKLQCALLKSSLWVKIWYEQVQYKLVHVKSVLRCPPRQSQALFP